MRLIDADDLKAKIMIDAPDFMECGSSITKAFIMAMLCSETATPTIDAVPVVRCKDCKRGEIYTAINGVLLSITCNGVIHRPEWFCADGERRDDDA